jgi:hypothetical protein
MTQVNIFLGSYSFLGLNDEQGHSSGRIDHFQASTGVDLNFL